MNSSGVAPSARASKPQVEELQAGVEPFGLELLFAAVLKTMKQATSAHENEQQQEEPPVVGEATPQTRTIAQCYDVVSVDADFAAQPRDIDVDGAVQHDHLVAQT